jgi:hypothetical protein
MAKKSGRKVAKITSLKGVEGVDVTDKLNGETMVESLPS